MLLRRGVCCYCTQIRVFCRVRPHPQSVVRCLAGGSSLSLALDSKEHHFNFDKVFGPGTQQQQVRRGYTVCRMQRAGSLPAVAWHRQVH